MAVTRSCSLLIAGYLTLFGAELAAQTKSTLTDEQNRLSRMEQSLENRQVELEDIENEVLSYDYKLKRAQESLASARTNYEQSRRELQQAERDHQLKADSETERQLHKAKHAFSMAERGVDSRSRRVEFIQTNFKELDGRISAAKSAVAESEQRVAAQQQQVERVVQSMLNKADALATAAAAPKPAQPAPVSKPVLPQPTVAALDIANEAADSPSQAESQIESETVREIDPDLLEYVTGELQRLEKLFADSDEGKQTFRNLELRTSNGESLPFEFLGHNQYRLVAPVAAGRQTYKINSRKFRRTIPADDEGVSYVFVFDARRPSRPRLVMYPEYVLSYLK